MRDAILAQINSIAQEIPDRVFYSARVPSNPSPIIARRIARAEAAMEKAKLSNPGKWPVGFNFASLDDDELLAALIKVVRLYARNC